MLYGIGGLISMRPKHITVEKIDVIFSSEGCTVLLNDEDYTDRIRKIIIDLEAEKKADRIHIETKPDGWAEFLATFK